jgi:hypothetical protein
MREFPRTVLTRVKFNKHANCEGEVRVGLASVDRETSAVNDSISAAYGSTQQSR